MIRLAINSSRHLETKMVLPMPEKKKQSIDVDYYFFTPSKLHVNSSANSRESMLRKFVTHGRYASPLSTFSQILDMNDETSSLTLLTKSSENFFDKNLSERSFISEAQSLIDAITKISKLSFKQVKQLCENKASEGALTSLLIEWTDNFPKVVERIRSLLAKAEEVLPETNLMRIALVWSDEALSSTEESYSLDMYIISQGLLGIDHPLIKKLMQIVKDESNYRNKRNYPTANKNSENSSYRRTTLKKWSQSVLYLNEQISRTPQNISFIIAGVAAAIAMGFALVMTIFANKWFVENSTPYLALIIISYAFKDRIKEGLRAVITKLMPRLICDQVSYLKNPRTDKKICKSRSKVQFTKPSKVPAEIIKAREDYKNPFRHLLPEEDVLHYTKYLTISKDAKNRDTKSFILKDLDFITRIRLDDWFKEMDDTVNDVSYYEGNKDEIAQEKAMHLYHVHLIIKEYSKTDKINRIYHHLLVLSRQGIMRTELISTTNLN